MKYTSLFSLAVAVAFGIPAINAATVNISAGGLEKAIGNNLSETSLTITGELNAADFAFINDKLSELTSLDLSNATVVAYSGDAILAGRTTFPANAIPAYGFFGSKIESIILPSTLTEIETAAFAASALTAIDIPQSVVSIQSDAWSGCKNLTSITIPSTVKEIGTATLSGCTALKTADFSASVTAIPASTFKGDTSLAAATIADNISQIGDYAFSGCSALKEISLPAGVTSIGDKAFYSSGLISVDLSLNKSLTSVGEYAFALSDALTKVSLPNKNITLGDGVFFDDTALTTINLPSSLTVIPAFTFKGNSAMTDSKILPSSLTNIGDYALMGWTDATDLVLPAELASIGDGAMENWTSLANLDATALSAIPETGSDVWEGVKTADAVLLVAADMYEPFHNADQWSSFNVQTKQTSIDTPVTDSDSTSGVTFSFRDHKLLISSVAQEILSTAIYDIDGRCRLISDDKGHAIEISLDRLPAATFLVSVRLADGSRASIKINNSGR